MINRKKEMDMYLEEIKDQKEELGSLEGFEEATQNAIEKIFDLLEELEDELFLKVQSK